MVRTFSLCLLYVLASISLLSAQIVIDPFTYPAGPTCPIWTEAGGDWSFDGDSVQASPVPISHMLLWAPGIPTRDLVTQVDVAYTQPATQAQQAVGISVRVNGTAPNFSCLKMETVDSNTDGNFDLLRLSHVNANGVSTTLTMVPLTHATQAARLRLSALDESGFTHLIAEVDSNLNNRWDTRLEVFTPLCAGEVGKFGLTASEGGWFDNYKMFDAVLASATPARIGKELNFKARSLTSDPFQAGSSTLNVGLDAWGTMIPLYTDELLVVTVHYPEIFSNFAGYMDACGDATLTIFIPPEEFLIGITFYTAFLNFHWLPSAEVTSVSNDVQKQIGY